MDSQFLRIFLVFSIIIFVFDADGQSTRVPAGAAKYKYFQIPGRVKLEKGDPNGAVVKLINLDSKQTEKSITVSSSGKFDFELSFFKEYKISVTKDGCYDKEIDVSTVIPRNVWDKDSIFPPFFIVVTLYEKVEGVRLSFEGKTIGKVSYSPNGTLDNFDSKILIEDQAIQDEINDARKIIDDKAFNQKVAEALEYEKKDDLSTAFSLYSEAIKLKPSDKFVKEKLKELAYDLKNLVSEAKIQAEFNRLIALGDANVVSLKYSEAILNFKGALKVKPKDPVALTKLANAEKLFALAGEMEKKDAEFTRLIAVGDEYVRQSKYAEGIENFKSALSIKPGDSMALARISDAEKLLALAGEKAKQEAEFTRLIAVGDENVVQSKYAEGIASFKSALNIKPGDSMALARISDAEKLLALAGEKAKQDAEFTRLITVGDENVRQSKYVEGIGNFKSALSIKPGDSMALARIADAEKLLALAGEKAKKEAEFTRLIAVGDENVRQSKFTDGIGNFKSALSIKPGDSMVLARISDAEKLLALAGEKAKQEAEFTRLIAVGDENVVQSKYAEGIASFKSALNIKPGDSMALARIADAEKLLALAGEKVKKEAEFTRLIAVGDENVRQSKYTDGIGNFKSALSIKPGDSMALARIVDAEKLLALAGEKAKQEAEFTRLIAAGDMSINAKKYNEALTKYQSAQELKNNDVVKAKIAEAERLIQQSEAERLALALKQQKYNEAIDKADQLFTSKSYPEAKVVYGQAMLVDQTAAYPGERIREIDKILTQLKADALAREQENIRSKLYGDVIKIADENFKSRSWSLALANYTKALDIRPNEVYPKNRIQEVNHFIALENASAKLYNDAMNRGMTYFSAKHYADAIMAYREAQKIRPSEILPPEKIKEIQSIIDELAVKALADQKSVDENKLSAAEKSYSEKIKTADENYQKSQWSVARFYYIEALKIKQNDNYSIQRIDGCDKMIDSGITAEKMLEFKRKLAKADDEMKAKNYSTAKFYYRSALDILRWETYPQQQLKEIDRIVAEQLNESDQRLYKENVAKADDAFNRKEYPTARFYYSKAIEISPGDQITARLKEIESIVNGSESKKINATYDDLIKKGDEAVIQKNTAIARFYFQKANALKPNENYPREVLRKIDSGAIEP